jgi:predicted dehydrogenase
MKLAIVGCGYVADFYMSTLPNHPQLELSGIFDRNPDRAQRFAEFHHVRRYKSLEQLLNDPSVDLVANLTNPKSHFEVSMAALRAGKHVYSEKPLAMNLADAQALVEYATAQKLLLAGAPCNVLGESAQTIWKALRAQTIGTPRLVYAELDDGPVPYFNYKTWISESGAPWPYIDEFEVGCTFEHAGYWLGMLAAFFGPAARITSFSHVLMDDKQVPLTMASAPDFAVACIEYKSGVVVRITCSIYATHDHRLRIFGDGGTLSTDACWHYGSPVYSSIRTPLKMRLENRYPKLGRLAGLGPKKIPLVRAASFRASKGHNLMDFCRGMAEMADSLKDKRPCRLSAAWSLHVNELVFAMQYPDQYGASYHMTSSFEPMSPMPWAS